MQRFPISLVILLSLSCLAAAQEPFTPAKNIFVEMQVVAIPTAAALPLVADLTDPSKAEAAYAQVQQLLMKGGARLIGWPTVTSHFGQRAVMECITEIRYPTTFEDGGVDVFFSNAGSEAVQQPAKIKGVQLNAIPRDFETRNVGVTLEMDSVLSPDEQTISISLVAQHVRLKGMRKVSVEREPDQQKLSVEQPEFETNNVTTSLKLQSGRRTLLGTFAGSGDPAEIELFLLKAETRNP